MLGFSLLLKTGLSWEVARFIGPGVYSLLRFPVGPVTLTLTSFAQKFFKWHRVPENILAPKWGYYILGLLEPGAIILTLNY